MARELREVFYVDGVRTAFGRAGPKGVFWRTRADDLGVKVVRELLRRNPTVPPQRIDDVVMAATAQVGDQGLTLGRDVALLAGRPEGGLHRRGLACGRPRRVPAAGDHARGALHAADAIPARRARDGGELGGADRRRHRLSARLRGGAARALARAANAARLVRIRRG